MNPFKPHSAVHTHFFCDVFMAISVGPLHCCGWGKTLYNTYGFKEESFQKHHSLVFESCSVFFVRILMYDQRSEYISYPTKIKLKGELDDLIKQK